MADRSAGFWAGGARQYRDVLCVERAERLAPLSEALEEARTREERAKLEAQIEEIEREYDEREREIGDLLF